MHRSLQLLVLLSALATAIAFSALFRPDAIELPEPIPTAIPVAKQTSEKEAADREKLMPDPGESHYSAPVSSRLSFQFRVHTDYRLSSPVDQPGAETQTNGTTCRGRMDLVVADRRDKEIAVRVEFAGVTGAEELRTALAQPLIMKLGDDGTIRGYRFAGSLTAQHRQVVRNLLANFSFVVPAHVGADWNAVGSDATGSFEASYRRLSAAGSNDVEAVRRKLRYTRMGNDLGQVPEHRIEGDARCTLSRKVGWLTEVRMDETIHVEVSMMPASLLLRQTAELRLVATDRAPFVGPVLGPAGWKGPWAAPGGEAEDLSDAAAAQERDEWQGRLAGVTLADVLGELRMLLAERRFDSEEAYMARLKLVWLARLQPKVVAEIRHLLAAQAIAGDLAGVVLSALGKAATDEAQDLLLELHQDVAGGANREHATMAMIQIAAPKPELLRALAGAMQAQRDVSRFHATNMLVLGALAPRNPAKLEGDRTALEVLFDHEQQARRVGATDLWLDALGNAGVPAILPRVQPYLADPSPRLREVAVAALRRLQVPRAVELICDRALRDPEDVVRFAAVQALAGRGDALSRKTIERLAKQTEDEALRRLAEEVRQLPVTLHR